MCPDASGLLQVKLQGIPGIRKVFMRELKTTHLDQEGIYQTEQQWVLDTEGVNLLDVRLDFLCPCLTCCLLSAFRLAINNEQLPVNLMLLTQNYC